MSNDPNYPQYPPPGHAPVQAPQQAQPQAAPPQGYPPPGYVPPHEQQPQAPQAPPALPPGSGFTTPTQPAAPQAWAPGQGFAQLPPELAAELQGEMAKGGSGGVDFDDVEWWNPAQPSTIGQTTESTIRILPSWTGEDRKPYWHKVQRHFCQVETKDGKRRRLPRICPRHNVPEGQPGAPCPVCERKDRADQAGDKETSNALVVRSRFYLNVLNAEDLQSHYKTDKSTGQPIARAKAFGIGAGLFKKIGLIIGSKGPVYDRNIGRFIKIFATKTGKEARDVRYDAMDASDACPLPQGFENVEMLPLDQLDMAKDYIEMAREISNTYPDAAGMAQPGLTPPQAAPPYASPYAAPAAPAPYQAPYQGAPPQHQAQQAPYQAPAPPAAPPGFALVNGQWVPAPQAPPSPPAAPPGWALVNGQWVPAPQAPQQAPLPPQAPPQYAPPQPAPQQAPPAQAAPQAPPQGYPPPGVGGDGIPF